VPAHHSANPEGAAAKANASAWVNADTGKPSSAYMPMQCRGDLAVDAVNLNQFSGWA
jgi:hypothetical protein